MALWLATVALDVVVTVVPVCIDLHLPHSHRPCHQVVPAVPGSLDTCRNTSCTVRMGDYVAEHRASAINRRIS